MKTLFALMGILIFPSMAWAQALEHPAANCSRPETSLIRAPEYSIKGNWAAADRYNAKVKEYNRQAADYDSCIRSYISNAKIELKRIQDDANDKLKRITDGANIQLKRVGEQIAMAEKESEAVAAEQAVPLAQARAVAAPRDKLRQGGGALGAKIGNR
jgi:hypothetical protein